eukprot:3264266-Heterocapsa_arctica.AAC.1
MAMEGSQMIISQGPQGVRQHAAFNLQLPVLQQKLAQVQHVFGIPSQIVQSFAAIIGLPRLLSSKTFQLPLICVLPLLAISPASNFTILGLPDKLPQQALQ